MILESSELKSGKEKNYGIWGDKQREFKLSIRWNEKKSVYECFKLYFDTDEEEILFNNKKLVDIIIKTCNLANYFQSINRI